MCMQPMPLLEKKFEEEVNNLMKGSVQRQLRKKRPNVFNNVHYKAFAY
jgi:hypothetical protein